MTSSFSRSQHRCPTERDIAPFQVLIVYVRTDRKSMCISYLFAIEAAIYARAHVDRDAVERSGFRCQGRVPITAIGNKVNINSLRVRFHIE